MLLQLGMLQNRDGKSASMKFDRLRDATKKLAQMTSVRMRREESGRPGALSATLTFLPPDFR